jgi:hypothetical protein
VHSDPYVSVRRQEDRRLWTESLQASPNIMMMTGITPWSPSWQAVNHSVSHIISRLLWNPKFHYIAHMRPPLVSLLIHMHSLHIFPPFLPKIHSNIIFPITPMSSDWSLPFNFSDQNLLLVPHLSHACYMLCPSPTPRFDTNNNGGHNSNNPEHSEIVMYH